MILCLLLPSMQNEGLKSSVNEFEPPPSNYGINYNHSIRICRLLYVGYRCMGTLHPRTAEIKQHGEKKDFHSIQIYNT